MFNDPRSLLDRGRRRGSKPPRWTDGRMRGMPAVPTERGLARQDAALIAIYDTLRPDRDDLDSGGVTASGVAIATRRLSRAGDISGEPLTTGQALAALKALRKRGLVTFYVSGRRRSNKPAFWALTEAGYDRAVASRAERRQARAAATTQEGCGASAPMP